jgi:3-hydroxyacyl-CoA dehydrogenase/enoyl-CoA hydratase/3-hydroxybutyryl-CoA epimerase
VARACATRAGHGLNAANAIALGQADVAIAGGTESMSDPADLHQPAARARARRVARKPAALAARVKPFQKLRRKISCPCRRPSPSTRPASRWAIRPRRWRKRTASPARSRTRSRSPRTRTPPAAWKATAYFDDEVMHVPVPPKYATVAEQGQPRAPKTPRSRRSGAQARVRPQVRHGHRRQRVAAHRRRGGAAADERRAAQGARVQPLGFLRSHAFAATDPGDQLLQGPRTPRRSRSIAPACRSRTSTSSTCTRPSRRRWPPTSRPSPRRPSPRSSGAPGPWARSIARLNVNGGSIAIGHPFAATGARIVHQALRELEAPQPGHRPRHRLRPGWPGRGRRPGACVMAPNCAHAASLRARSSASRSSPSTRGRAREHARARRSAEFEALLTKAASDVDAKAVVFISGKKDSSSPARRSTSSRPSRPVPLAVHALAHQAPGQLRPPRRLREARRRGHHGACLGGGLEWALACDYRLATDSPKTSMGLPEVQLGLIPGAGGTQRLPRLIGAQAALDLILTGKALKARRRSSLGVVDEVVPHAHSSAGRPRRALELADGTLAPDRSARPQGSGKGRTFSDILKGLSNREAWAEARARGQPARSQGVLRPGTQTTAQEDPRQVPGARARARGRRVGLDKGHQGGPRARGEALRRARDVRRREAAHRDLLRDRRAEEGQRHAQRRCEAPRGEQGRRPRRRAHGPRHRVRHGDEGNVPVRIKDKDDAAAGRGLAASVRELLRRAVREEAMLRGRARSPHGAVSGAVDYSGFKSCDIVIEAVFEDLDAQAPRVEGGRGGVGLPTTIFASNTSSIPIAKIAEGASRPERSSGCTTSARSTRCRCSRSSAPGTPRRGGRHRVEVGKSRARRSSSSTTASASTRAASSAPYMNEAAWMLTEGADRGASTRGSVEFGFPVGPITLLDEVGIDTAAKVGHIMHEAFGDRLHAPRGLESGCRRRSHWVARGKKGFYRYGEGKKKRRRRVVYKVLGIRPARPQSARRSELGERLRAADGRARPSAASARASCARARRRHRRHLRPRLPAVSRRAVSASAPAFSLPHCWSTR